MKIFTINKTLSVVCQSLPTRTAFKHEATLIVNGSATDITAKICYQNRTWERYQYESVLQSLADKMAKEAKERLWLEKHLITFKKKINNIYN